MMLSLNIALLSIISILSLIGILIDAFIVVFNVQDWAKGRSLNTCDRILLAVGISGIGFQCIVVVEAYVSILWNHLCDYILPVRLWTGFSNVWLTAALSVFYCVKIVDFNHPLFIRLKLRLPKAVSWLSLVSVMGCLVLSTSGFFKTYHDIPQVQNSSANATADSVISFCKGNLSRLQMFAFKIYGLYMPFLLAIVSIIVLLSSLYRHTWRMKENASRFSQPRMDAHYGAARVVGFLMLSYVAMFLSEFVKFSSPPPWLASLLHIVTTSFMAAQAAILIFGNTKLRQGLWKLLSSCRK